VRSDNLNTLPADLPVPFDDGSCDHLAGMRMPTFSTQTTEYQQEMVERLHIPFLKTSNIQLIEFPKSRLGEKSLARLLRLTL